MVRPTPRTQYACGRLFHGNELAPDCPKSIGGKKVDDLARAKVIRVLDDPELLIVGTRAHVDQLRAEAESVLKDQAAIQARLDGFESERQNVIRLARRKLIADDELSLQFTELDLNEWNVCTELAKGQENVDLATTGAVGRNCV